MAGSTRSESTRAVYDGVAQGGLFFFRLLIRRDKVVIVVDTDDLLLDPEHHLFLGQVMGDEVSIAVMGELAFLSCRSSAHTSLVCQR